MGDPLDKAKSGLDEKTKAYVRNILIAVLGLGAVGAGIFLVGSLQIYSETNNFLFPISLTANLSLDALGAVIPLIAAVLSMILYFRFRYSAKKLLLCFACSVALAFLLFRPTEEGVLGSPLLFALLTGLVVIVVVFFRKPFRETKKKYFASMLALCSCVPLSVFAVDLYYASSYVQPVIGGNGLGDALLVSLLYAPLGSSLLILLTFFVAQLFLLARTLSDS